MAAYYNENDPKAAAWLRELIKQGHIAPGDVDERSIEDVIPTELIRYTQCHFFAGIGVWSYALRQAGWPDDRPVWTGSCPCQPFSAAGKGGGFTDERHLWPAWFHLISQCRPRAVFGEQVASKDGLAWLDLVHADMEAAGYAFGAVDLCAAGIGAPHIRQRLYFVANADNEGSQGRRVLPERATQLAARQRGVAGGPGPANGFWGAADWLHCTDNKWRPVEPIHVKIFDGSSTTLGRVCAGDEHETEKINAVLRGLRKASDAEKVQQWGFGEPKYAQETEILRPDLYGKGAREGSLPQCESQQIEICQDSKEVLRGVRERAEKIACSPYGRQLGEQLPLQFDDIVSLMSPSRSLAELYGDRATSDALSALRKTVCEAASLPHTSEPLSEIWASVGEEEKSRIRNGFDASGWRLVIPFPLTRAAEARVARLRGYGNAIVAPLAEEFIRAMMFITT